MKKNKTVPTPIMFSIRTEFERKRNAIEKSWKENRSTIEEGHHNFPRVEGLSGHDEELWGPLLGIAISVNIRNISSRDRILNNIYSQDSKDCVPVQIKKSTCTKIIN